MPTSSREVAQAILEAIPTVSQAIRIVMRSQRQRDLSVPQFRTLNFIYKHPGCSLSAAASFIGLTLATMSVLVDGLVERGLVDRTVSTVDRRRKTLILTPLGEERFMKVLDCTEARLAEMMKPLSEFERSGVMQALYLIQPIFAGLAELEDDSAEEVDVDLVAKAA